MLGAVEKPKIIQQKAAIPKRLTLEMEAGKNNMKELENDGKKRGMTQVAYARCHVLVARADAAAFRTGNPGPRDSCTLTDHGEFMWPEQRYGAGVGEMGEVGRG